MKVKACRVFIFYQIIISIYLLVFWLIIRFICTWCWLQIFWFYSLNRSQKNQEISIQRSSNDVKTLRDQKSHHAEFSFTWQYLSNSYNWFTKKINDMSMSVRDEKISSEKVDLSMRVMTTSDWRICNLLTASIYWNVFITLTMLSSNWWKDIR